MDQAQYKEISDKMDKIIRLLALSVVKDMKTQKDKILYLTSFGFGPSDIATLIGTTSNTVNVALSKTRKKTAASQDNTEAEIPKTGE
jgi:DNA-directed RNA polymerase specialized sigma24 family protein